MALTTKRIIALPSQNDPQEGDYLAIDNGTNGTHKIPVGRIGVELDDTLSVSGKAADAKATGDAIDALRTQLEVTGTASGAIATFSDGADAPTKSCIATIVPKQAGSGTPSPENERPISGWESVSVNVAGVNVWDEEMEEGFFSTSDGAKIFNNAVLRSTNMTPCKPNTDIYVKISGACSFMWYGANKEYLGYRGTVNANTVVTIPDSVHYFNFGIAKANYGHDTYNNDISINYPSTDTSYHAYNPNSSTKTVNLGRTVYGGTLDVVSGALTVYPFYPSYNGETLNGRWICDRAVYAEGTTPPTGSQVALISGTGTTYQLTPTEVNTLLGENNVWADSGDISVTYVRDLNIAINNLIGE